MLTAIQSSSGPGKSSLVEFVEEDDRMIFGVNTEPGSITTGTLKPLADLVNITVMNTFPSFQDLYQYLDNLDILHPEHLRPSWDSYFMVGIITF